MLRKTRNLFNCLSEWVNTKKNNEWAVTLDMWKEGDGEETTEVYTNLGQKFGTTLVFTIPILFPFSMLE